MNFDLDQLRGFEAILSYGGFRAAADALGVPQSSLSQQISRLELELGRKLFARHGRRVEATIHARCLHDRVDAILSVAQEIWVAFEQAPIESVLRVGLADNLLVEKIPPDDASPDWTPKDLRRILTHVRRHHPRRGLSLRMGSNRRLFRDLDEGMLDIVLAERPSGRRQGRLLCRQTLAWFGKPPAFSSSGSLPLVLPREEGAARELATAALRRAGREFHVVAEADGPVGMRAAVASGFGVAALVGNCMGNDGHILPRDCGLPDLDPIEYVIDWRVDQFDPAVVAFVEAATGASDPAASDQTDEVGCDL